MFLELSNALSGLAEGDCELLGSKRRVRQEGGWFLGFYGASDGLELFFALNKTLNILADLHLLALYDLFFWHWGYRYGDLFPFHLVNRLICMF